MPFSWLFSFMFLAVSIVVLTCGIITLQSNRKAPSNRTFFALTLAISLWSAGMTFSLISPDAATSELWRRFSAIGWGSTYAILLHFIMAITGSTSRIKRRWVWPLMYFPPLVTIFAFAVPNKLNPTPYRLYLTQLGWLNTAEHNFWDLIFYAYFIGYAAIGLVLLLRWQRRAPTAAEKKPARIIFTAILTALFLGTLTDVFLSSIYPDFPQLAPVIMLIPAIASYHVLQRESFGIKDPVDKKTSYLRITVCVVIYVAISAVQVRFSQEGYPFRHINISESSIRGMIVQLQILISIFLVLRENRPGYTVSVLLNFVNLAASVIHLVLFSSTVSLPGIISYVSALVIITLIKDYKDKNSTYIRKINAQIVKENYYSNIFRQAPVGIAIVRDKSHVMNEEYADISINPMYERILGRDKNELQNITWTEITHPDDLEADLMLFEQFKQGHIDSYSMEKRFIKPDGSIVWAEMQIAPFSTSDNKSGDHVCIITDITQRKEIEATLKYTSEHDMLTGLYNRSVLERDLLNDAKSPPAGNSALIGINLSPIHSLSLGYGFHYEQDLLREISDTLKKLRSDDRELYSTYADRFVFYVKNYTSKAELLDLCKEITASLNSHLYVHGIGGGISVIELNETIRQDVDELLKKLLIASEIALRTNQKNIDTVFYGPVIDVQVTREIVISHELSEIVAGKKAGRLHLQFQPVYDVASNRICGFEALARLKNDNYGLVSPSEFIPIAEKTNMIVPLGEMVIRKAFLFLRRLKERGNDAITVSINVSAIQLLKEGFTDRLFGMLNEMRLEPESVGIEITESIYMAEYDQFNRIVSRLRNSGIKILIDDFGTGYSSFSRVRDLYVDYLKIDKSFVDRLMSIPHNKTITSDIISMAHKLGHRVVAEGVEYEQQLRYLRDHGCDKIQGHFISMPLDEESALEILSRCDDFLEI